MQKIKIKNIVFTIILFFIFVMLLIKPQRYMQSCLNGLGIWFMCVLPALFPFIVITKLITSMGVFNTAFLKFGKLSNKLFKSPPISLYIFFISIISGYPIGAKLISEYRKKNIITDVQAHRITAFCCTSGPMFIIGTVGTGLLKNPTLGVIILVSHILSAILNGVIFSHYKKDDTQQLITKNEFIGNSLAEDINSSITSILMVGGFIAMSYIIIDMLSDIALYRYLQQALGNVFAFCGLQNQLAIGFSNGLIEVTHGIMDIGKVYAPPTAKACLSAFLISFSGLSILLQCIAFLSAVDIKISYFLKTKFTHSILCVIICLILCLLIL